LREFKVEVLGSLAALRQHASEWNDLWDRSDVFNPTGRAELVAHCVEHFAEPSRFVAPIVRMDGRLVAALPIVGRPMRRGLYVAGLPGNEWTGGGDLLVDREVLANRPLSIAILAALHEQLERLHWPLCLFDMVPIDAPRWQRFVEAAESRGRPASVREQAYCGLCKIGDDWPAHVSRWSRNHRRAVRRGLRRGAAMGGLELAVLAPVSPSEIRSQLEEGFAIERRGWKGRAGSAVACSPSLLEFYVDQAVLLARAGALRNVFLRLDGKPIAFEYGYIAKQTYVSYKVAYDEEYGEIAPGQLLRALLIERFHAEGSVRSIQFLGLISDATAKFSTEAWRWGRITLSPRRLKGKLVLGLYRLAQRGKETVVEPPKLMATAEEVEVEPAGQALPLVDPALVELGEMGARSV
jgi:CelD/BcsL family acetyltransferase involved in cellulose biosynthesis